jgi:hypothetical protein
VTPDESITAANANTPASQEAGALNEESAGEDSAQAAVDLPEAYAIPRALAQATLDYLASQPYREVFGLVRAFEALEPLTQVEIEPKRRA